MTMHPLLHLIATQPQLLADHAQGYAELVTEEIGHVSAAWKLGVLLNAIALCCLGAGAVLAGVALMLWAVTPPAEIRAPWALFAAPLLPLAAALASFSVARLPRNGHAFDSVRQQVQADLVLLREASAS